MVDKKSQNAHLVEQSGFRYTKGYSLSVKVSKTLEKYVGFSNSMMI
jgi:hypothetical protein